MRTHLVILVVMSMVASGCARPVVMRKEPPQTVPARSAPPRAEEVSQAPLPDAPLDAVEGARNEAGEFRKSPKKYSLVLAGAEARQLFLSLARENDINLILSPNVTGTVTLDIKGATAAEIMSEVCMLLGCRIETSERTVRILPEKRVTRVFRVDYLLTNRSGSGSLTASTSTGGGSSSSSISGSTGGGSTGGGASQSANTISTEEKYDFWAQVGEELQGMLSGSDARVAVNKAAGTVVVTDYPQNLRRIAEYLETLEGRAGAGVMIEARILEITLDDGTKYGVDWSSAPDLSGLRLSGTLTGGKVLQQSLSTGATVLKIGVAGTRFDAFIDAMAQNGQIKVLSAPKVSTLNNQKAIIRVGRQDVFFRATVTPATTTSAAFVTYTPDTITEGIILAVTPQIGRDGKVILSIHPSITEKAGDKTAPDGNTAPIIDVRETNTVVSVNDGQTVFIGGLMQERTQEIVKAVPLLGDIPFFGAFFRSVDQTKKKTELVILITPHVTTSSNLAEIGAREEERILGMDRGYHLGGRPWIYGTEGEARGITPWR